MEVLRKLEFDAGHRLIGHESKCAHLHGHRYVAEITAISLGLDGIGRVVDFGVIKQRVGGWIDKHWDHNMILNPKDPLLAVEVPEDVLGIKLPYTMPVSHPTPTAENMAFVLYDIAGHLINENGLSIKRVRLWETPNCCATYPSGD